MSPELLPEQVRHSYSPESLHFTCTDELEPFQGILGQDRAMAAMRFALRMEETGYNVYASGPPGTGKTTAVKSFLEIEAATKPTPPDWCYVYDFPERQGAKILTLPCGRGNELEKDMKGLVERARNDVSAIFESDAYRKRREPIVEGLNKRKEALLAQVNEEARQHNFVVQATPMGIFLVSLIGGRPASEEEVLALPAETRETVARGQRELEGSVRDILREFRSLEKTAQEMTQKLNQQVSLYAISHLVDELKEKYHDLPDVLDYLQAVQDDMVENIEQLRPPAPSPMPVPPWVGEQALRKYQVSVIVDNSNCQGAPVVLELNPTYSNLFGRLDKESQFGTLLTDFTLIRPGSLHRANGGYLVLRADDLLRSPFCWEGLRRCLRDGKIEIEDVGDRLGFPSMKMVSPEPVPLQLKVVMIGSPWLYYLLQTHEPEFHELFRVRADFDTRISNTAENIENYFCLFSSISKKNNQKHLDASASAKMLEHSSRLADHQEKLSTRFSAITELLREADYWATEDGAEIISAQHVQKAIEQKVYRSNLYQERIVEMIQQGSLVIDTESDVVGQVNGLAVLMLGEYSFGRPTRISASVAAGREGLIDIEREARLGGPIHTKGVLITSGYLADKYAHSQPLSLTARLVFEQSYEEVEGDSASSAELYCLLSRLADLPIRQGIAVTGSVDQMGRVQAIGGVNQKIEGFYEVCKTRGLTGQQGVIIPASNVQNLMLREDVVEAVRAGQFHIHAVSTIDEGIEILTGVKAGKKLKDGAFQKGAVNERVRQRLQELAKGLRASSTEEPKRSKRKEEEKEPRKDQPPQED